MSDEPAKAQDGIAYVRSQCGKCGKWGNMPMPQDHVWDRKIRRLEEELGQRRTESRLLREELSEREKLIENYRTRLLELGAKP